MPGVRARKRRGRGMGLGIIEPPDRADGRQSGTAARWPAVGRRGYAARRAGLGGHQHHPRSGQSVSRRLRPRPSRGPAPRRGRGRAALLPRRQVELSPRGSADPPASEARALRPRPRPLRPGRLVRVARRGPAADRHLPRHRRPPPDRGPSVTPTGAADSTWSRAPPAPCSPPRPNGPACRDGPERPQCSPAAPISTASGRRRAPRRGSGWASTPRADTCCFRPRPSGPRSATTEPSRSGVWRARSC